VRRVTLWLASTAVLVVLLFSYHTSTGTSTDSSTAAVGPRTPGPTTAPSDRTDGSGDGTFTGDAVDTRWGPVQVQITVRGGRITDVRATVYPQGNQRDVQINDYALPVLHDEVLAAQSAAIDAVSGATVTSEGYLDSLQSALDAAHLGS
jgi:uncharacterized protein with FMN-binding domain